ncbi:MAG: hypothetical protein CfP315_0238 [Candidatus Improbicoccus pseudotrichonymphae]|uniref:Contractile injection system tube protein N-terminal domain-containing protein n=1 Tax=Candidatus Improbicoccus pseudotrichonymphae TaxID=3033792 RepID=A0AA48KYC5_9FIRM|nr:MAG: hypothetical protein CfP315_0238 [Candidatus Improbicoccus pseudotrichonymphae]
MGDCNMSLLDFVLPAGIGTTKYRTSTMYDFSCVVKAVLHILKAEEVTSSDIFSKGFDYKWEYKESLPVQINPSAVRRTMSAMGGPNAFTGKLDDVDWHGNICKGINGYKKYELLTRKSKDNDSVEINLIFDLYDEYKAITMGSMISNSVVSSISNPLTGQSLGVEAVTLTNKNVVIIEKLYDYYEKGCFAIFDWGDFMFLGLITELECDYNCFSPYGEPLKSSIKLTLLRQDLGNDSKGKKQEADPFSLGSKCWSEIQSYSKLNKVQVAAARATEEAASVIVPNILRKIRND